MVVLRERTGASLADCIAALRDTGDEDRAAAALARAAVSNIASTVGCPSAHAEAAHARWGWDLERACIEARRAWFAAEPAAEIAEIRGWRRRTLDNAERFDSLLPLREVAPRGCDVDRPRVPDGITDGDVWVARR
ncbi:MAG TPA: hypothetical protein VGO00_25850 [Kofleriaceae bacterium]|nr:hypothetical protein [Kofleriaceae bacterium]